MIVGRIVGATRNLGAPADWERNKQGIDAMVRYLIDGMPR
jgi:hypothetical protein